MSVTSMKTNDDKRVELEIKVDAETFEKAVDAAFKRNSKRMNVPVSRGKRPKMIERLYGEGVFYGGSRQQYVPAAYEDAVKEKGIEPVDRADIEVMQVGKDGYSFKATVTVKPEVSIEGYKGIEVEKKVAQATDAEVDAELSRMQAQNGRVIAVEGRAAQDGDTAVIDFEGFVDGQPFDGGKAEHHALTLGSGSFIPGFEDQIVGHETGEEFEISVKFPEEYQAENLKGKDATFKIKLHEIKRKELPVLDDEFAKDVSEFDTLKDLKADLKKKITAEREETVKRAFEDALMEQVAENITADVPDAMVEAQSRQFLDNFKMQLAQQGLQYDQYMKATGMDEAQLLADAKEPALKQVRMDLAMAAIIKEENIDATDEEVEAEFQRMADQYGMDLETVKKYLQAEQVKDQLKSQKAIAVVVDSATAVKAEKKPAKKTAKKAEDAEGEEAAEEKPAKKTTRKKADEDGEEKKPAKKATKKAAAKKEEETPAESK